MEEEMKGHKSLYFVIGIRSVVPEYGSFFVKVESLLIAVELVMKLLACMVNLALHCVVAVVTKVLTIEVVECLTVLGVVDITRLDAKVKKFHFLHGPSAQFCFVVVLGQFFITTISTTGQS